MAKVAIVGDATSVSGFRPLGFEVFVAEDPAEARDVWPRLVSGEYAAVFVTEQVYERVADLAAESMDKALPAVTVVPGAGSTGGVGGEKLAKAVERALGTRQLIGEEEG